MSSFSSDGKFAELDSKRKSKLKRSEYDLNDFNLKDFYKSVKLSKMKKSRSGSSQMSKNSSDNGLYEQVDSNEEFAKNMTLKRSKIFAKIGSYKGKYPEKMGIAEYLLHSYVVLFSPNPVTLYSYEAVLRNLDPENEEFWTTLRTLTKLQLDVDDFPSEVFKHISLLLEAKDSKFPLQSNDGADSKKLDDHFTWLCKCCIDVVDAKGDEYFAKPKGVSGSKKVQSVGELKGGRRRSLRDQLALNNVFGNNYDLSSDVLYEALRQRGNRFVQRSLYNNVKNLSGLYSRGINPNLAAKLNEPNGRVKRFMDVIQQSSLDSSDPSSYNNYYDLFGEERRHSSRRSMLMRRRYA